MLSINFLIETIKYVYKKKILANSFCPLRSNERSVFFTFKLILINLLQRPQSKAASNQYTVFLFNLYVLVDSAHRSSLWHRR